ncbi:hypothetical protein AKJ57_05165 [candidate division MSBL1 archaeon SCGC-AAA259A05]|uniref:Uncharacterized protein n=1 Tax=candidate division MSBL1 archaeon SCGC-AAA259A05 TaxID=1698259 RepID=A0A133U5U0_9EURY|nr:hypothetical protein AKJ57_05165 [candidate division MSBL1 archaeon SCGC-AAA259A05]
MVLGVGLIGSLVYHHQKISTLKSEKIEVLENLENLESSQKILQDKFENLEDKHSILIENYKYLEENFRKIENDYQNLSENYGRLNENYLDLKFDYRILKENHQSLEKSHHELEENYLEVRENYFVLENNYENLVHKYSNLEEEYSQLKGFKDSLSENHEELKENYERIENELTLLREGNRYELHDPTYIELVDFLENDTTDENLYNENTYVCFDFSKDLIANATDKGSMAGYARIAYWENHQSYTIAENNRNYYAHAIVAFKTVDEGLVYVEPQNDVVMKDLTVGDSYWNEIEKNSSLNYFEWPKLIITDIDVIW